MISSPNRSRRTLGPVIWVVIHTAEGARTAQALGNYFAKPSVGASSHVGIDDHGIEQYVPYSEAAWTLRGGNSISDNAELCGFATWSRETWLNEHRGMLDHAAAWIRERCLARGIPIRKLTPADVAARRPGVIGHHDYTVGARDGSHWDPGPGFPWDYVMERAAGDTNLSSPNPEDDDNMASIRITPDQVGRFHEAVGAEAGGGSMVASRGWVSFGSTYGGTTWTVAALSADGKVLAYWAGIRTNNNRNEARELPAGTRCVTVEGQADNAGTRPWASTWSIR